MTRSPSLPATWSPGAVVPGTVYRIIRPLGSGGMGDVYEAEHELLGVRRAVKVISRKLAAREDLAERLRVEARALANLKHPNLVEVNDLGVSSDGRVFFAMELLVGSTLRDRLHKNGRMRIDLAVSVATQVLDALSAAHERGMIHRDVKPENVFLQQTGPVKLLDFGVAKALFAAATPQQLTAAGVAIGTPRYMAPEQAQGMPVDIRVDVYAVGIVLWEMLAGRPPFGEEGVAAAVAAVTRGVQPIEELGIPNLPDALAKVVRRATARERDHRFASAAEMAAALRSIAPISQPTPTSVRSHDASGQLAHDVTEKIALPDTGDAPVDLTDIDRESAMRFAETLLAGEHTSAAASVPSDNRNQPTPTRVPLAPAIAEPTPAGTARPTLLAPPSRSKAPFFGLGAIAILVIGLGVVILRGPHATPVPQPETAATASVTVTPSAQAPTDVAAPSTAMPSVVAPPASTAASAQPMPSVSTKGAHHTGSHPATTPVAPSKDKSGGSLPSSGL